MCLPLQWLWEGCNSSLPFHRFNNVEQGEREGTRREGRREGEREGETEEWRGEAGERAEMRHAKTLVCNQVTGAVRIVLVCGQLLQPFKSALQRLAHLRAHGCAHTPTQHTFQ